MVAEKNYLAGTRLVVGYIFMTTSAFWAVAVRGTDIQPIAALLGGFGSFMIATAFGRLQFTSWSSGSPAFRSNVVLPAAILIGLASAATFGFVLSKDQLTIRGNLAMMSVGIVLTILLLLNDNERSMADQKYNLLVTALIHILILGWADGGILGLAVATLVVILMCKGLTDNGWNRFMKLVFFSVLCATLAYMGYWLAS